MSKLRLVHVNIDKNAIIGAIIAIVRRNFETDITEFVYVKNMHVTHQNRI